MAGHLRMTVCGVFDSAVQAYGLPFFARSRGEAIRSFMDEVRRDAPENPLFKHPEDYELRLLGYFDQEEGAFDTPDGIEVLMRGKDVRS